MASVRSRLDNALTILLVGSALAVATVAVHREFSPGGADSVRSVPGWEGLAGGRAPALGNPRARHRIILFSDFQCPYCRDLERKLEAALPSLGDTAVVRYDLPLTRIHARAYPAALAARCAARQGRAQRFDALLFSLDLDRPRLDFGRLARRARVPDIPAFVTCMEDPATARGVDADMAVAHRLGIDGVPALIVNGELHGGTMDTAALEALLAKAR